MLKEFDEVELVGRAIKIPNEGLTFTRGFDRYTVYPVQTSERIYNHSKISDFYIFSTEFGTYVIPFFFGIEILLQMAHFKKVGDDELTAHFDSQYMPVGTKIQSMWYHMTNVVNKYNAIMAYELLKLKGNSLKLPSFIDESSKIPFSGIYDSKKGRIFYPMASIRFPHCDEKKLGNFNFDSETQHLLVYAGDGNTYLLKAESLTSMVATLKDAGYKHDKSLYVPIK